MVVRVRGLLLALLCWMLLSGGLVTAQGFWEDGGPGGAPETFGTEPSRVGDRGLYKTALVIVDEDGTGTWVDMEARYAFERTADRFVLDRHGDPVWTRSFVAEWETEPFEVDLTRHFAVPEFDLPGAPTDPGCGAYLGDEAAFEDCWEDYGEAWDAWGDGIEGEAWVHDYDWDAFGQEWAAWADQWEGFGDEWLNFGSPVHRVRETPWHVTHHDEESTGVAATYRPAETEVPADMDLSGLADPAWTQPAAVDGPCGYRHSLQGAGASVWEPVVVHGACPPPVALDFGASELLSGPIEMLVSGTDTVGDWDTTVYAWAEDSDRLRLWFAKDVAYPVRILDRLPEVVPPEVQAMVGDAEQPTLYVMHELIEYAPGTRDDPPAPTEARLPPAEASRRPWGPDETGLGWPWSLGRAHREALADDALSDWAKAHPDAEVYAAASEHDRDGERETRTWRFGLSDGTSTRLVTATLHSRPATANVGGEVVTYREHRIEVRAEEAPVVRVAGPERMPSAAGQVARFQAAAGAAATAYGFDLRDDSFWVRSGDGASARTLWVEPDGDARALVVGDSSEPEPRFQDAAWDPYAASPWTRTAAERGIWQWPEPKTAAALAGLAAGATLLAFGMAMLKTGSGVGLFSRIAKADLLEHPVRNDIMVAASSEPGIHFQELVRRVGKGRGTTEHHVRKLVSAGLLTEHTDKGFTCYFAKGHVDRRVMVAAPILKSDGARSVLHAVAASPGCVAKDLAAELGMAPSTVNYHLRKLTDAGLVQSTRRGRFLALEATETGAMALGTLAS